ncbi:MAG: ABC transporter substrate-binding protein, partial [Alphaproteobacteria bacterium]|nr:ABC transporter substrate-binding protein [Alphaproteobacteria bacterium]
MIFFDPALRRRFAVLILSLLAAFPARAEPQPVAALAMHGVPKYAANFKHFDYVNPDAPQGGGLRLGVVGTFDSLNPFIVRGQVPQGLGLGNFALVYESLMARSWDEPFTLYGLIAESVEVPEDRSSITFNFNPAAHWQDGKPITADDVLFSYETLREQGRPNHRTYYKKVERAEKLGERRLRFVFQRAETGRWDREMPLIMGLMPVLPRHDWQNRSFNQTSVRIPLGSGPYKVAKVDLGRSITYERDSNYWGRDVPAQRGMYNFASIRFDYFRDDNIALQAFKSGSFDLRREPDPNKWATAYGSPAVTDGRVSLTRFAHHRPEATTGFILNTRRPLFQEPALREALGYAFDFGWINRSLFHGLYKRTESFYPNSELATDAAHPPQGKERALLETYRDKLPTRIFSEPVAPPSAEGGEEALRANLLKASERLKEAGYVLRDSKLYAPQGEAVSFEVMLSDPTEEKVALEWARALGRIGIEARVRTVDSAQFQARLTGFDFDVTTGRWFNSLSPGNEQVFFWGS